MSEDLSIRSYDLSIAPGSRLWRPGAVPKPPVAVPKPIGLVFIIGVPYRNRRETGTQDFPGTEHQRIGTSSNVAFLCIAFASGYIASQASYEHTTPALRIRSRF